MLAGSSGQTPPWADQGPEGLRVCITDHPGGQGTAAPTRPEERHKQENRPCFVLWLDFLRVSSPYVSRDVPENPHSGLESSWVPRLPVEAPIGTRVARRAGYGR